MSAFPNRKSGSSSTFTDLMSRKKLSWIRTGIPLHWRGVGNLFPTTLVPRYLLCLWIAKTVLFKCHHRHLININICREGDRRHRIQWWWSTFRCSDWLMLIKNVHSSLFLDSYYLVQVTAIYYAFGTTALTRPKTRMTISSSFAWSNQWLQLRKETPHTIYINLQERQDMQCCFFFCIMVMWMLLPTWI